MSSLSQSTTVTPAVETAPATTAAAGYSQTAGNAAAQDAAGLSGDVPGGASNSDEALVELGECANVMLDAMPLCDSVPLALRHLDLPAVCSWLQSQDPGALISEAADAVLGVLDGLWPVGLGFALAGEGSLALELELGLLLSGSVQRVENGFEVIGLVQASAGGDLGIGGSIKGADGEPIEGNEASVGVENAATYTTTWLIEKSFPDLLVEGGKLVDAVIFRDVFPLIDMITSMLSDMEPTSHALQDSSSVSGEAQGTIGLGSVSATGGASVGTEAGISAEDGAYFEVNAEGNLSGSLDLPMAEIIANFLGLEKLQGTLSSGCAVRVMITKMPDISDLGSIPELVKYQYIRRETVLQTSSEDVVEVDTLPELFAAIASDSTEQEDMPDAPLSRSFSEPLTPFQLSSSGVIWGKVLELIPADFVINFDQTTTFSGTITVGPDALTAAAAHVEAAEGWYNLQTAIADTVVSTSFSLIAGLDDPAILAAVGVEDTTVQIRLDAAVGGEVSGEMGGKVGGSANVSAGVFKDVPLSGLSAVDVAAVIDGGAVSTATDSAEATDSGGATPEAAEA